MRAEDQQEKAKRERIARAKELERRICSVPPKLPSEFQALHQEVRGHLIAASNNGALRTSPGDIFRLLKKIEDRDVPPELRAGSGKHYILAGGKKDFSLGKARDGTLTEGEQSKHEDQFERADGALFNFAVTLLWKRNQPLTLVAYNFHLQFPAGTAPAFLRFDLNPPGHSNEELGLRSHIHPGTNNWSVPSPMMGPVDILDRILYGCQLPEDRKADRR